MQDPEGEWGGKNMLMIIITGWKSCILEMLHFSEMLKTTSE